MRLTPAQQSIIRDTLKRYFGPMTHILLLGSRTDDNAKGGDIDLYIEPDIQSPDGIIEAKLKALAELHRALGEQKIDLIIRREHGPELSIHRHARANGLPL